MSVKALREKNTEQCIM